MGLAFVGLLLPVWVDDTVSILWWGLAAIAIVGVGKGTVYGKRASHKKQQELLEYLREFINEHSYAPVTVRL